MAITEFELSLDMVPQPGRVDHGARGMLALVSPLCRGLLLREHSGCATTDSIPASLSKHCNDGNSTQPVNGMTSRPTEPALKRTM